MLTIRPDTSPMEDAEHDKDLSIGTSEESINAQNHQHYHVLRTSGKVPAGFLHYLTSLVSKQGHDVVLLSEQEA